MSRYADVEQAIWTEPVFMALSATGKTLFLWAISNPHANVSGLYAVSRPVIELETGLHGEALAAALDEVGDRVSFHEPTGTVWVPSRTKRLRVGLQANTWKGILTAVEQCPHTPFAAEWIERYRTLSLPAPKDAKSDRERAAWGEVHARFGELQAQYGAGAVPEPKAANNGSTTSVVLRQQQGKAVVVEGEQQRQEDHARTPAVPTLPDGLRGYLVPVADALRRVAAQKPGAIEPADAAVAKSLQDHPNKDFLPLAQDFEHYWTHGAGAPVSRKDIVATWRNWIVKHPDVLRKTPPPSAPGQTAPGAETSADRRRRIDEEREEALREARQ